MALLDVVVAVVVVDVVEEQHAVCDEQPVGKAALWRRTSRPRRR